MSKKLPRPSAAEQAEHDRPPGGVAPLLDPSAGAAHACRNKAESGQRNGQTSSSSSSPESDGLNGEGKRNGKSRRRKKRSSNNPESGKPGGAAPTEEEEQPEKPEKPEQRADTQLVGLHSECANVWLDRSAYERAESLYQCWLATPSGRTAKNKKNPSVKCAKSKPAGAQSSVTEEPAPSAPDSLNLPSRQNRSDAAQTPDEGYQSLAPTPGTPATPATPATPVNGLPRLPVELLRDVWLEKPLYDRAEAAFYQNLYGNNSTKRPHCGGGASSSPRGAEHPQSLVEEEEEEEEEEEGGEPVEDKRAVVQGKAEVFHALLPIQEEEEPAEGPDKEKEEVGGVGAAAAGVTPANFLHPDSEPIWMDKWRYDAAEGRFHRSHRAEAATAAVPTAAAGGKKPRKTQPPAAPAAPPPSTAPTVDNNMASLDFLAQERIWFDKVRYDEAERRFYERVNGSPQPAKDVGANSILQDIARARENIQKSLAGLKTTLCSRSSGQASLSQQQQQQLSASGAGDQGELVCRIRGLELENQTLNRVVESLRSALSQLECRVAVLEKPPAVAAAPAARVPYTNGTATQQKSSASVTEAKKKEEEEEEEEDDDIDLFGSDDDEEAEKIKEQRLKDYADRKAKKPALIAKSSILLDVKPWDDETDMAKLEECVRSVQTDGLLWGSSKLVAVGYGIKKLQIACVVEDDKVGTDLLEEEITKFEDYVQSVDVAAFNKI
ncbi:uncharacterized protein LOC142900995 [Nelusetta ayraudi]|uniref:uncharacterized protein LOC142900995 n=1 Tax=Nelusetta ayraudi TaxID=303726 RepID=UPI003F70D83A